MKITRDSARIIGALVVMLGIAICSIAYAANPPKGIDPNDIGRCTVFTGEWDNNTGMGGISLRTAIYYANNPSEWKGTCVKSITLASDVDMLSPLYINAPGLVIDGGGHYLKSSPMSPGEPTDGANGQGCAIYINSSDVTIYNLKLDASGRTDFDGICIGGTDVTVANVEITGARNGIKLLGSAARIFPDVVAKSSSDFAINDASSNVNVLFMYNKEVETGEKGDVTNAQGFVQWKAGLFDLLSWLEQDYFSQILTGEAKTALTNHYNTELFMSLDAQKGLLTSVKKTVPLITKIEKVGQKDSYRVSGILRVLDNVGTEGGAGSQPIDCKSPGGTADTQVQRLALFQLTIDSVHHEIGYQFKGLVGNNAAKGVDSANARFEFLLNKTADDDPATLDMGNSQFVLVPLDTTWNLRGRASNKHTLTEGSSDCTAGTSPSGGNNGSNGNTGGGQGSMIGFNSVGQCNQEYEFSSPTEDDATDSDLDGIPDVLEMRVVTDGNGKWFYDPDRATCDCAGTLTCWYMTDTDGDGIPDNKDNYGLKWVDYYNQTTKLEITDKVVNTDKDYPAGASDLLPDVRDTDSDKDGLWDGVEDRSRTFRRTDGVFVKAYLYATDSVNYQFYPAKPGSNEKVDCTDLLDTEELKNTGIRWGIFRAGGNAQTYISKPTLYNMFDPTEAASDTGLWILACINDTVTGPNNFNGLPEPTMGETNPRSPDTDSDCVCDGDGMGCTQVDKITSVISGENCKTKDHSGASTRDNQLWLNDGCPLDPQPTKECTPKCIDYETLNYVRSKAPEWLKHDDQKNIVEPLQLKDEDSNNIPDLFEQTKSETDADTGVTWTRPDFETVVKACSDIDNDGIPDCVERFDGLCSPSSAQNIHLDPYKADSDGDGLMDGTKKSSLKEDVCPFSAPKGGQSDEFTTSGTPSYSCDPRMVYTQGSVPKILACFLDRDDDGVRDCVEDKDMDGQLDPPVSSMQGIFDSESDILKVDTDDDSLNDTVEIRDGWPFRTNPNKADTDDDGVKDKAEDRNNDGLITLSDDRSSFGCGVAEMTRDTDPRKADTDGDELSDGMEIANVITDPQAFLNLIDDPSIWGEGGISHGSNPNAKDADGDGLPDGYEYNGSKITYFDSNPCMKDSDGDGINDADEYVGCALNKDPTCKGSGEQQKDALQSNSKKDSSSGIDSDGDGLSDLCEAQLGTLPDKKDTDNDGVNDGDEDPDHDCLYQISKGETNPLNPDSDNDAISDGMELKYGSDPTNPDSDGDCITDGIEDANRNGSYDAGSETNALAKDSDGDGLYDGSIGGFGEDLNCNGVRDQDPASGEWLETDPRLYDSDFDGNSDFDEMTHGGAFNITNLDRATEGREGCSIAGTAAGSAPSSMFYLMLGLLAAVKAVTRRMRKTPA